VLTLGDNQYANGPTRIRQLLRPDVGRFKANIFPPRQPRVQHEHAVAAGGYFDYFFKTAPLNTRIAPTAGIRSHARLLQLRPGAWHIIALNTNTRRRKTSLRQDRVQRGLRAGAMAARRPGSAQEHACVLAYCTSAVYCRRPHERRRLAALWADLYQYNADVVLNGHDHNYQRFVR